MSLLKNLKIIILVIGILLVLILIRISNSNVFKGHVKSAVEVVRDNGNTITLNRTYYYNYLILQPGEFKQWNAVTKRLNQAVNESIILKQK